MEGGPVFVQLSETVEVAVFEILNQVGQQFLEGHRVRPGPPTFHRAVGTAGCMACLRSARV